MSCTNVVTWDSINICRANSWLYYNNNNSFILSSWIFIEMSSVLKTHIVATVLRQIKKVASLSLSLLSKDNRHSPTLALKRRTCPYISILISRLSIPELVILSSVIRWYLTLHLRQVGVFMKKLNLRFECSVIF